MQKIVGFSFSRSNPNGRARRPSPFPRQGS
jgi:hypothetical protein